MDHSNEGHGVLSDKLRNLTKLGCALVMEADQRIPGCVVDCLAAGATRAEVMEVLNMAVLTGEIRADKYAGIVRDAMNTFEGHGLRGG